MDVLDRFNALDKLARDEVLHIWREEAQEARLQRALARLDSEARDRLILRLERAARRAGQ